MKKKILLLETKDFLHVHYDKEEFQRTLNPRQPGDQHQRNLQGKLPYICFPQIAAPTDSKLFFFVLLFF